jgi:hypothetical protein
MNDENGCLPSGSHKRSDDRKMTISVSNIIKLHPYLGENQASSYSKRKRSLRCHSSKQMLSRRFNDLLDYIAFNIDDTEFIMLKLILAGNINYLCHAKTDSVLFLPERELI